MKNGLFFLVRAWHLSPMTAVGPHRFAFGAMQFGGTASAADAAELYAACRAAGITHFDTAHAYTNGASERLLGDLVRPERDAVFIATKAGYVGGASRQNILSTFDESRQRLQLDHVDLLYLHRFDDATPLEETFETLAKLQSDGLITHIGVSNFAAWQVMKAQAVAARLGTSISYIQPMYNLVKRQAEVEILPMAQAEGLVPCTYSPLGGGVADRKIQRTTGRIRWPPGHRSPLCRTLWPARNAQGCGRSGGTGGRSGAASGNFGRGLGVATPRSPRADFIGAQRGAACAILGGHQLRSRCRHICAAAGDFPCTTARHRPDRRGLGRHGWHSCLHFGRAHADQQTHR